MIRPIMKDTFFLQQVSEEATKDDLWIGQDLLDTLLAHRETCVGLAANMIGLKKRVIIFLLGNVPVIMYNPVLKGKSDPYQAEEGCLSLQGSRTATRYREIRLEYRDQNWQVQTLDLTDFSAQICQHELDHLEGILI